MANAFYGKFKEALAAGFVFNWAAGDYRAMGIDSGAYTPSMNVHEFLADVAGGARIATMAAALANKTNALGVLDADDAVLTAAGATQFELVAIYLHTGVDATARLVALLDTFTSGMPYTPAGAGALVTVEWSNGADKVLRL
jgi:hypothetical protein